MAVKRARQNSDGEHPAPKFLAAGSTASPRRSARIQAKGPPTACADQEGGLSLDDAAKDALYVDSEAESQTHNESEPGVSQDEPEGSQGGTEGPQGGSEGSPSGSVSSSSGSEGDAEYSQDDPDDSPDDFSDSQDESHEGSDDEGPDDFGAPETWREMFAILTRDHGVIAQQHTAAREEADPHNERALVDNDIAGAWGELCERVDDFADELLGGGTKTWQELSLQVKMELHHWTKHARDLLEGDVRTWSLYVARIWHTLDERVFSAGEEARRQWMRTSWRGFARMMDTFKGLNHDRPWVNGEMDAAYNVWKWYTAHMLNFSFGTMLKRDAAVKLALKAMDDLRTLFGGEEEDIDWMAHLEPICELALDVAERMLFSSSKTWIAWEPINSGGPPHAFPVSETTDEGSGVMMEVYSDAYPYREHVDPRRFNGRRVQFVLRPALANTVFYRSSATHHVVAPIGVFVGEHLQEGERSDEDVSSGSEIPECDAI